MKLAYLLLGTSLALVPVASAAATLEVRIDGSDSLVWSDSNDDGFLTVEAGARSGYENVTVVVVKQLAPPADQLLANVIVANTSGAANESIRVEVTGHFQNNAAGIWPGMSTATANDVMGSKWNIETFVGAGAYDTGAGAQLTISASGSLLAMDNLIRFNANDYWITHVFDHTATSSNVSASASADAMVSPETPASVSLETLTPIPVPAAGVLLLGALGGLAALRRRKG